MPGDCELPRAELEDFEVVVVDDGSADRTAGAVAAIPDRRVRLIRHGRNRGVCPARNTGIRASSGKWVVFLDSDHEMLPGCLDRAFQITGAAGAAGIDRFGFMFQYDDGRRSPSPFPRYRSCGVCRMVALD